MQGPRQDKNEVHIAGKRKKIMAEKTKITILIIEDDVDHAFLEEDILTDELNCHVKIVRTKAELEQEHIIKSNIILLDFNLPDATGSEILTEIRRFTDIPVLMITGDDQLQTAVDTLKGGATDFLIKSPDNIRQLPIDPIRILLGLVRHQNILCNTAGHS